MFTWLGRIRPPLAAGASFWCRLIGWSRTRSNRAGFPAEELESLADSIRQKGVIQPLIVRRKPGRDVYEIVAGERRWRAAQLAQLHEVPVVVRDLSDSEVLEVAIIENIQREDLMRHRRGAGVSPA